MTAAMPRPPVPWIVGTHLVVRIVSFSLAFVVVAHHIWGQGYGWALWLLLVLQFLLYPHLVYWRASRAAKPQRAELQNLLLDGFLFGAWVAWLGFPQFIAFTFFICVLINNAITRGVPGILLGTIWIVLGALFGAVLSGGLWQPEKSLWVTLLAGVSLTIYLLGIGVLAHQRTQALRLTREALKLHEAQLQALNQSQSERLAEIERLQVELREQAFRDPLTGLFNRRYLQTTMEREWARCAREQLPLSVLLLDVDHFKQVNDRFGHAVGDQVLVRLGQLLQQMIRREDLACRYGGEEFLLLLPGMGLDEAYERAQQFRLAFANLQMQSQDQVIPLSLSIGVASAPEHASAPEPLIHRADLALYAAKAQGRNRVELAGA